MELIIDKTNELHGEITVPSSKSHTIRAIIIASLAEGTSKLINPLFSEDTKAAINACCALGAKIKQSGDILIIEGFGINPKTPSEALDMMNSGTSTNLMLGILAAFGIKSEITGDASLRSRPVAALCEALTGLGLNIEFLDRNGYPPLRISGRIKGGTIEIDAGKSSQYVSSLLMACPLLEQETEIIVINPTELPYIEMTLKWLDDQGIKYSRDGFSHFRILPGQIYKPFEKTIPSDWSSATFPICAAAVTNSDVLIRGIDLNDIQGDKVIVDYLKRMGADIEIGNNNIRIKGKNIEGIELDINATPDALPALSVIGCYANGRTKLFNVAQARVKETDRIKVMAEELKNMGAEIEELPAGLMMWKSSLKGARVNGHNDHRVVMALSIAGLIAEGRTTIDTAEAVSITYPGYVETMQKLGAKFKLTEEVN